MATVITVPATELPVGIQQFDEPSNFATNAKELRFNIGKVSWPHAGGTAFVVTIFVSNDSGQTYREQIQSDFSDVPWIMKGVEVFTSVMIAGPLPFIGSSTRRLRVRVETMKANVVVSGSAEVN